MRRIIAFKKNHQTCPQLIGADQRSVKLLDEFKAKNNHGQRKDKTLALETFLLPIFKTGIGTP